MSVFEFQMLMPYFLRLSLEIFTAYIYLFVFFLCLPHLRKIRLGEVKFGNIVGDIQFKLFGRVIFLGFGSSFFLLLL